MQIWGPYSALGLVFAAGAVTADQVHKSWMIGLLEAKPVRKIVLSPYFDLVLVWNHGISYGLFNQESGAGRLVLTVFALVAVLALAFWLAHLRGRLPAIGAGLIMGGALGNALDRLHYGAVADFFSFHVAGFYWYIFNLADVAIVAGVAGLLYNSVVLSHKTAGKTSLTP